MKNKKEIVTEEGFVLKFYPPDTEEVTVKLSTDVVELLEKKAKERDMPLKALLKFYIAQGLRQDLTPAESKELFQKRMKSRKGAEEKVEVDLVA